MDMYVITNYTGKNSNDPRVVDNEFDNVLVYILHWYSHEDNMYDWLERRYMTTDELLGNLRENNSYNIQIGEVRLGNDRKYLAKAYRIPYRVGCMEMDSERSALEMMRERGSDMSYISSRKSSEVFIFGQELVVDAIVRTYVIERWTEQEVYYLDRTCKKAGKFGNIHFATYTQVFGAKMKFIEAYEKKGYPISPDDFKIKKVYKHSRDLNINYE